MTRISPYFILLVGIFGLFPEFVRGIGTIVPLYVYPEVVNGVHNWQPLIDSKSAHGSVDVWAIVNVNSGPGRTTDPNYVDAIKRLKTAGVHTLGYVSTNYSERNSSLVQQDINRWKTLYAPNGIFFDEMKYEACSNCVTYYSHLNTYAKSQNFTFTVGNPGTDTRPEFTSTVDTIMIVENDSGTFPSEAQLGGWHDNYPRHKWGIFPLNISQLNNTAVQMAKKHIGFIYATNDVLPNPWDALPPYLNELLDLLSSGQ